jgi:hypothetical protein
MGGKCGSYWWAHKPADCKGIPVGKQKKRRRVRRIKLKSFRRHTKPESMTARLVNHWSMRPNGMRRAEKSG